MINIENIKKDCPKSISKYKAYIKVKIIEAQKDVVKQGLMEEKGEVQLQYPFYMGFFME